MTDTFLPEGTEIPEKPSSYMRFKSGDNRIRIVSKAITGSELWIDGKPIRRKIKKDQDPIELFTVEELKGADINKFTGKPKLPAYFWAFAVFNYESKKVEILEVTQVRVLRGIESYLGDEDYGADPSKYDLVINRDDDTDPVMYTVRPKPPKKLDEGIREYVKESVKGINLQELFLGGDPFNSTGTEDNFNPTDKEMTA